MVTLWCCVVTVIVNLTDLFDYHVCNLDISSEQALDLFYQSRVYQMLVDPSYGLQTMSDTYIYDEFILELRG